MINNKEIKKQTEKAIKEHAEAIQNIQENKYDIENVLLSPLLSENQELSALFNSPSQIQKAKINENSIDYVLDILTKYRQKLLAFAKDAYSEKEFQAKFGNNPLKTDTFKVDEKTDYEEKLIKSNLNIARLFINVISDFQNQGYSNENKLATQSFTQKAKLGFALASPLLQLKKYQDLIDNAVKPEKSAGNLQLLTTNIWYETYDYLSKLLADDAFGFIDNPSIVIDELKPKHTKVANEELVRHDIDDEADLQRVQSFNKASLPILTFASEHHVEATKNIAAVNNTFNQKVESFKESYQAFISKEGKPNKQEKTKLTIARHALEQEAKAALQEITQHTNEIDQFVANRPSTLYGASLNEAEPHNTLTFFKKSFEAIKEGMVDLSNAHNKLMNTPELNELVYENVIASFDALSKKIEESTGDLAKLLSEVDKVEDMINEFNTQAKAELATTTEDAQAAKDAELEQFSEEKGLPLDYINKPKEEHVERLRELAPKSITNTAFSQLSDAHEILSKQDNSQNPRDIFIIPFNKLAGGNTIILAKLSGLPIDTINGFNIQQIQYNKSHQSPADDISLRLRYKHPKKYTKEEKQLLKNKQALTEEITKKYQKQNEIFDEMDQIVQVIMTKQIAEQKYSTYGDSKQGKLLGELTDQLKSLEEKSPELQKHKSELQNMQSKVAEQAKAKTTPAPKSTKILGVTIPELSLRSALGLIGGAAAGYFINPIFGPLMGGLLGAVLPDNVLSLTTNKTKTEKVSKTVPNEKSSTEVMFENGMKPEKVIEKGNDESQDENKENQGNNVKVGENISALHAIQNEDQNNNNNLENDIPKLEKPNEIKTLSA